MAVGGAVLAGCNERGTVLGAADAAVDARRTLADSTAPPEDAPTDSTLSSDSDAAMDGGADQAVDALGEDASDTAPDVEEGEAGPDAGMDADAGALDSAQGGGDSSAPADAADSATGPVDTGAAPPDSAMTQDSSALADTGSVDATLHDSSPEDSGTPADSGAAPDTATFPGTITCVTTKQEVTANGCVASVLLEKDVGLFPVNLPSLGWAGGLGTNSVGITELYTNGSDSTPNPSQQLFVATDPTLSLYVGFGAAGDGGPGDWGTAHRTDSEITSFTLNVTKEGTPPPNCDVPELSVQCSGSTTLGCQWYGGACGAMTTCCPDSIFTPVGDAGPWSVSCTSGLCCNPSGAFCNTGVACCSGVCSETSTGQQTCE
jgi:hypothetical protein